MRQHAVLITVLFALTVTLVSVSVVFWKFFQLNKQHYIDHIFTKHATITQIFRQHEQEVTSQIMLEANLAIYDFVLEKDRRVIENILKNAKVLKKKDFKSIDASLMLSQKGLYTKKVITDLKAAMLEFNKKIYFYIESPSSSVLILDEDLKPYKYWNVAYAYLIIIAILSFSFMLILQKLRPLIRLRKKIALYGNGDMNISFKTNFIHLYSDLYLKKVRIFRAYLVKKSNPK